MRLPLPPQSGKLKRLLPRSLLGRTLLIVLVPLVVVQAVALQVFYGSHLRIVSRRLSASIAGEVAGTIDLMDRFPGADNRSWILRRAWDRFELAMEVEPDTPLPPGRNPAPFEPRTVGLYSSLRDELGRPFSVDWRSDPASVLIRVDLGDGILNVEVPRKRLYATSFYVFLLWLVGSSLLLFTIAALFMRNQVRALRRLAAAAEAFGVGRDIGPIKPEGATEVRQAGIAFNRMQERIRRFLQQRTEMLAGVSHDLRTPLTRMRLALAVMPAPEALRDDVAGMAADIDEMERMIAAYLAFARGEGAEQARPTDLSAILVEVAGAARRGGAAVALQAPGELIVKLRPDAVRRAITNLIDNARRHASHVALAATRAGERAVQVTVDDDGPGIAPAQREAAFRPFESGAAGGTGLGLSIARDIVRAHGGDITLEDSPLGGLRARIQLPV
ncbi:MAG: HAMP domain-containing protein [Rhodospirillales bacterium]|nr:HAMP domain-containing protein [Rhodospirillales bacterium]MDE2573837.1 HAMP domain-containing protein [Rhodospirillales bacterium]